MSQKNNVLSTIKTYIEDSSSNHKINTNICNIDEFNSGKLKINKYQNRKTSLEQIQAIYFDQTILSLIKRKKMEKTDYFYYFYIFFIRENYRSYVIQLGHKNFSKFFKKFFNSCIKSNIFSNYDFAQYIDCCLLSLYQLITGFHNENDIKKLKEKQIINLKDLDSVDKKYMKLLVKYILAFCNILGYTKEYKNYPYIIFESFSKIKDNFFYENFMKQLNSIYLNKGLYVHGQKFIEDIFNSIISNDSKRSIYDFTDLTYFLVNTILHYQCNYFKNNNNKSNILHKNGSPFYFLNLFILNKIFNNMNIKKNLAQKLTFKFTDIFNNRINLFIDDDNKIKVAECLLIDTTNNKSLLKLLDTLKLIQNYFKLDENQSNNKVNKYFEYLFFDLTIDRYIIESFGLNDNIHPAASNYQMISVNDNNNSNEFSEKECCEKICDKFNNSKDYFINKYLNNQKNININEEEENEKIIAEKSIEELFILLDMLYYISIKFPEKPKEKIISDINIIIKCIIIKTFKEKKFNCSIFNFILNVEQKYLPLSSEFNIIKCNEILLKNSFVHFIKTYPIYIIFIINYFTKNNLQISELFSLLKSFMEGYNKKVFNSIDENMNEYNHTLQINYLNIIYFIINKILNIYYCGDKNNNDSNITKIKIIYLTYCINCQKKIKDPLLFSKYLCQCNYCGEKFLYINTNLDNYIYNNKNETKKFIDECIFDVITGITCNILYKFKVKYDNRNINSMFCYNLYYKIMSEHFQFLNEIKLIIGKNIPFVIDTNCDINNKEGSLEEYMNIFFERYLTNQNKYPFKAIYDTIDKDNYESFNSFRKTIKHECLLAEHRYIKK